MSDTNSNLLGYTIDLNVAGGDVSVTRQVAGDEPSETIYEENDPVSQTVEHRVVARAILEDFQGDKFAKNHSARLARDHFRSNGKPRQEVTLHAEDLQRWVDDRLSSEGSSYQAVVIPLEQPSDGEQIARSIHGERSSYQRENKETRELVVEIADREAARRLQQKIDSGRGETYPNGPAPPYIEPVDEPKSEMFTENGELDFDPNVTPEL